MNKPMKWTLGSLGAAALLIGGGLAIAIPAQASTTPAPGSSQSADNGSAADGETADDTTSVANDGETADDTTPVENGTNDGETADDAAPTPGQ